VWVHLNGRLVTEEDARVSIFDRGLLFGDGVFETMRAVAGRPFRLERHARRLERSAGSIGLDLPWPPDRVGPLIHALLEANRLSEARLRLTITRGRGRPGDFIGTDSPPTVIATAAAFQALPARDYMEGVKVSIASASVLARREARQQGAREAILLNGSGCVTEGTASNIFLVEEGALVTPPAPEGSLPGITREAILELTRESGRTAREEPVAAERLHAAREIFLTNTSWEVLPVTRIGDRTISEGRPGPVTCSLLHLYRSLVRRECGAA
jgi:branched-chain amino acid aminotransferase